MPQITAVGGHGIMRRVRVRGLGPFIARLLKNYVSKIIRPLTLRQQNYPIRALFVQAGSATDGSFELTATDKWCGVKKPIATSLLNIENAGRGISIAVFRYSKSELAPDTTLETFSKAMQVMFLYVSDGYHPEIKESVSTKIRDFPAFVFESTISSDKSKVRYLFINLETPTYFYKLVYSSTTRSGFNKPEIRELLDSFKEIEAIQKGETPNPAAGDLITEKNRPRECTALTQTGHIFRDISN